MLASVTPGVTLVGTTEGVRMDSIECLRRMVGGDDPHQTLVMFWLARARGMRHADIAVQFHLRRSSVTRRIGRASRVFRDCGLSDIHVAELLEQAT